MTTQMIREAVDGLHQAFQEFKSANDERLSHLEAKGTTDPLTDEKVNRLNEAIDEAQSRLNRLETAAKRPQFTHTFEQDTGEKAAFFSYVRKGMEAREQKSS